jgi:hypothetical protein
VILKSAVNTAWRFGIIPAAMVEFLHQLLWGRDLLSGIFPVKMARHISKALARSRPNH